MRLIAIVAAASMIVTGCFVGDEPQAAEFYAVQIDGVSSNLVLNNRPNMNTQVKRVVGHNDAGQLYFVDLCLGLATGNAVNPIGKDDLMLCFGPANELGMPTGAPTCYDGRSSAASPQADVSLVTLGADREALSGNVNVTVPSLTTTQPDMTITSDFQVVVNREEPQEREVPSPDFGGGGSFD